MRAAILLSSALLLGAMPAWSDTCLVRPDGSGDFATIQAALDAARDGDVIELADGTFTGEGNRDVHFLGKAVTVRSQSADPTRRRPSGGEGRPWWWWKRGEDLTVNPSA